MRTPSCWAMAVARSPNVVDRPEHTLTSAGSGSAGVSWWAAPTSRAWIARATMAAATVGRRLTSRVVVGSPMPTSPVPAPFTA